MKTLILVCFLIASFFCLAQTDKNGSKLKEEFCLVRPMESGSYYKASIDHGEKRGMLENPKKMKDETGKDMVFDSVVKILEYMSVQGWTFVTSYNRFDTPVFVFRRPVAPAN